ncbi:uncharacterized protein [Temnothorax nylanderi]|uniref:uncharacterized protein n=1 Tax=Temnothorax nylanderi TaxID=102681 RepID=UPI003A843F4A
MDDRRRATDRDTRMATRKRLRLETPQRDAAETPAIATLTETLQAVIEEVQLLRVEQARREKEYTATIRRQEEELRRLRGTNSSDVPQLSSLDIRASGDTETRAVSGVRARNVCEAGAVADGTVAQVTGGRGAGRRVASGARARDAFGRDTALGDAVICAERAGESVVHASERSATTSDARVRDVRSAVRNAFVDSASESGMRPTGRSANTGGASENVTCRFERDTGASAGSDLDVYSSARNTNEIGNRTACARDAVAGAGAGLGYKLKPDTYDGSVPLQEYFSQFNLIARANFWDDTTKTVALASSLRGKARAILETVQDIECLNFSELKSKLELRFGEGRLTQNYYSALTNRRQKFGEDLAALGSDIERLSRLAYPECPYEIREKIACSQFVTAVADHFIRRTLQMEGITSLCQAVERAKALKIIQGEGFGRGKFNGNTVKEGQKGGANVEGGEIEADKERKEDGKTERKGNFQKGNGRGNKFSANRGECWTCGKTGHFRSECPEQRGNAI